MRAWKAGFAALAFASTFAAGCSQQSGALAAVDTDPKAVEALVTKLSTESFKGKATAAADIAAVKAALPKEVALNWSNLSFDAASGATVLTDVKLTPADMPTVGLSISELRLWDFDAAFAAARLSGQRLTEAAPLARRIDAKGVSLFGLAATLNGMTGAIQGAVQGAVVDAVTPAPGESPIATPDVPPAEWPGDAFDASEYATSFDKYDFGIGRIILDDIVLRPFEMAAAKPATDAPDEMATAMSALQQLAAVTRSFGIDTAAMFDIKSEIAMKEAGQTVAGSFSAKTSGTRGWRGADYDATFMRDMSYNFDIGSSPILGTPSQKIEVSMGLFTLEDMRLDKVFGYLAKGVMPPRTESDLMSLGVWGSQNENWKLAGKDLYSAGESTFDARGFHWFIPTDIKASGKNVVLNIGSLVEIAEEFASSMGDIMIDPETGEAVQDPSAASSVDFKQIEAALEKHGLAKPNMNYNFGWNWNAGSGDAKLTLGWGADNFLKFDATYEGGFPSFKAVSDLIPDDVEKTDTDAVSKLFEDKTTLKLIDLNLADSGGLDKLFGVTADLAPLMGMDMGGGSAPSAETLRMMAVTGVRMMADSAGAQMPEIPALLNPVAVFLTSGGNLKFTVKPGKPMTFSAVAMSLMGGMSPGEALKQLGVKVEQSGGKK